jgi:hypothetical protein
MHGGEYRPKGIQNIIRKTSFLLGDLGVDGR